MSNITKAASIGLPAFIGLGLAWIGVQITSNEKRLKTIEMELKLQHDEKSIKGLSISNQ